MNTLKANTKLHTPTKAIWGDGQYIHFLFSFLVQFSSAVSGLRAVTLNGKGARYPNKSKMLKHCSIVFIARVLLVVFFGSLVGSF